MKTKIKAYQIARIMDWETLVDYYPALSRMIKAFELKTKPPEAKVGNFVSDTLMKATYHLQERPENHGVWLAFDNDKRLVGYIFSELNINGSEYPDCFIWQAMASVPGLASEGLKVVLDWGRSKGCRKAYFFTRRSAPAYERRLKDFGFKPMSVLFETELEQGKGDRNGAGI